MTRRHQRSSGRAAPARCAAVAVVAALLLAGCGDAEEPAATDASEPTAQETTTPETEASPSPTGVTPSGEAAEGPACEDVWVAGERLPQGYQGCRRGDRWVEAFVYPCSSGQRLVTYGRTFYAAKGERINESGTTLARDPGFRSAMAACGA